MLLPSVLVLILAGALLGVLESRFTGTRRWLLRVLATPEVPKLQFGLEGAVNDRWLALCAVGAPAVTTAGVVAAFVYAWWVGILSIVALIYLLALIGRTSLVPRALTWYLDRFLVHARRIERDCVSFGEPMRIAIASDFVGRLEVIRAIYEGSSAVAPKVRDASAVAFGDSASLLHANKLFPIPDATGSELESMDRNITLARERVVAYGTLLQFATQECMPVSSLPCSKNEMKSAILFVLSLHYLADEATPEMEGICRAVYGDLSRFVSPELAAESTIFATALAMAKDPSFATDPALVRASVKGIARASRAGVVGGRWPEILQLHTEFDRRWAEMKAAADEERATVA